MVWKVVIERVTVIKFRIDNGGGNGAGCFEVEIWASGGIVCIRITSAFDLEKFPNLQRAQTNSASSPEREHE